MDFSNWALPGLPNPPRKDEKDVDTIARLFYRKGHGAGLDRRGWLLHSRGPGELPGHGPYQHYADKLHGDELAEVPGFAE